MKKILIVLMILFCATAHAQLYQSMPQPGYYFNRGWFEGLLTIPTNNTQLSNITGGRDVGRIRYNVDDSSVQIYTGYQWLAGNRASVGTTPTWQNTLDATNGKILTADNNIDVANNKLIFSSVGNGSRFYLSPTLAAASKFDITQKSSNTTDSAYFYLQKSALSAAVKSVMGVFDGTNNIRNDLSIAMQGGIPVTLLSRTGAGSLDYNLRIDGGGINMYAQNTAGTGNSLVRAEPDSLVNKMYNSADASVYTYLNLYPARIYGYSNNGSIDFGSKKADQYADDSLVWRSTDRTGLIKIVPNEVAIYGGDKEIEVTSSGIEFTLGSDATGDIWYRSSSGFMTRLADVATGNALISGGVGAAPSYGKVGLTTHVSGTLPVANGGTGLTSYTSGGIPYANSTSTLASSGLLAANALMIGGGPGAAPSTTTTGTGVLTALGVNVGSAGAFVTFNGAGGTPSSMTGTNITGIPEGGLSTTDITTNNATTSKHGFLPKLTANSVYYVNNGGSWTGLTVGAANTVLAGNGVTSAPTWTATSSLTGLPYIALTGTSTATGSITVDMNSTGDFTVSNGLMSAANSFSAENDNNNIIGNTSGGNTFIKVSGTNADDALYIKFNGIGSASIGDAYTILDPGTGQVGFAPNIAFNLKKEGTEIYASNGSIFAKDKAGNKTQISPHNKDGDWVYNSTNAKGSTTEINMTDAIKTIEQLTKRVYELEKKLNIKTTKPKKLIHKK